MPRTSAGASGLGSKLSWCDRPPPRYTRMTFFARCLRFALAALAAPARESSPPTAPTRRKSRREPFLFRKTSNIGQPPRSEVEEKFLRVQQRPEQVLQHRHAVSVLGNVLLHRRHLGRRRLVRQRGEEQLLDDLVVR